MTPEEMNLEDNSGVVSKALSWIAEEDQNMMHLGREDLRDWKGVERTGIPAYEEWAICINNRGQERPDWDITGRLCKDRLVTHSITCEDVYDEELNEFVTNCSYCLQYFNETEPICTQTCENASSYVNEFQETVFDVVCVDPVYQLKLDAIPVPTAPPALRIIFQIIAAFFEIHIIAISIAPWYLILLVYQFVDFLIDWIWYAIFFAWCLPCAWVFIWIFNIAFLPITVWGYVNRFQLELIGFIFDFWLLFFKGDGCFLRWGNYCW